MLRSTAAAILTVFVFAMAQAQTSFTSSTAQPPRAASSPAQQTVRVRKGTLLKLQTEAALGPDTARPSDDVPLRLTRALYVEGVTLLPAGTLLHGTISKVTPPNKYCRSGEVVWQLKSVTFADASTAKARLGYRGADDIRVPDNINDDLSPGDRAGTAIRGALVVPLVPPLLLVAGIQSLAQSPHHGHVCSSTTGNKPLPARSTVVVEILEPSGAVLNRGSQHPYYMLHLY